MASIAQISRNEQGEIEGTLKKFFTDYKISSLLKACRAEKQKGHSAFEIFRYLLCLVFCDRSMYMQIMTGRYILALSTYADTFFPYEKKLLLMWNSSSVGSFSLSDLEDQTLAKSNSSRQ